MVSSISKSIFGLVVHLRRGNVCYIGGSDTLPPPLTREEELNLMMRMAGGETGRACDTSSSEICASSFTSPGNSKIRESASRT